MDYVELTANMMKVAYGDSIPKKDYIMYLKGTKVGITRDLAITAAHVENIIRQNKFFASSEELKSIITMLTFGSSVDYVPNMNEIIELSRLMSSADMSVEDFVIENLYIVRDKVFAEYSTIIFELITFMYAYHMKKIVLYCGIEDNSSITAIISKVNRNSDSKVTREILNTQRTIMAKDGNQPTQQKRQVAKPKQEYTEDPMLTQDDFKIPDSVKSTQASSLMASMMVQ